MSIEETYGFGILNEGQAIAVAKNVKIRPNEFVMPARKASKQHIPGLFFLWAGKRLARGRRPRPEPGSVIETNAHAPQPGERPLASQVEADAPFRPAFEVTGVSNDADNSGLVIAGLIDHGLGLLIKAWAGGYG
jgi:hypothetical protein